MQTSKFSFFKASVIGVFFLLCLTQCQTSVGSSTPVSIPTVQISCSSGNCASASGSHSVLVYLTTSGCENISYGQVATGNARASCSSGTCTASVSSWTNLNSTTITQVSSGVYDFCALIDLDDHYVGTISSQEVSGSNKSVSLLSSVSSISILSWVNGGFSN